VGALLAPVATRAASFRIELPALSGAYDAPGDRREAAYDLGARLATIDSIAFELEIGDADPGGMCTLSIPGYCTPGTSFTIVLRGPDGASFVATSSNLQPNARNSFGFLPGGVLDPEEGFIQNPWPDFLFDREGDVTFELRGFPGPGASLDFHRGEIRSATLVINGTPVPSPSTAASILLGLAMLARPRRAQRLRTA
jgi:hypothetical protein